MIFRVTFKTPDVVDQVIASLPPASTVEEAELLNQDVVEIKTALDKFVKYGELITIQFDTVAGTATVV